MKPWGGGKQSTSELGLDAGEIIVAVDGGTRRPEQTMGRKIARKRNLGDAAIRSCRQEIKGADRALLLGFVFVGLFPLLVLLFWYTWAGFSFSKKKNNMGWLHVV